MHTTDASLGPGHFTLITQRQQEANKIRYFSDDDPVILYVLTVAMHVDRKSDNSRIVFAPQVSDNRNWCVHCCLDLLSCYPDVDRDENINAVLRVLSVLRGYQEQEAVVEAEYTHEQLNEMVPPELRVIGPNNKKQDNCFRNQENINPGSKNHSSRF